MEPSPSPALAELAEAIRRHRKATGLTQQQLADLIPCSDKTIRSHALSQRESLDFIRRTMEERWT